jgi:hypothetical protein
MAPVRLTHPALKAVLIMIVALPGMARPAPVFTELDGVPEELAMRAMAMDTEWSWSFLGLVVLVAALLALGPRRDKDK